MARISMWKQNHSKDYKFFDKLISEQFTVGSTDILINKYLGPNAQSVAVPLAASANANVATVTLSNVANVSVGQMVSGIGIASNTVIVAKSLSANTITFNNNTVSSLNAGAPISIYWNNPTQQQAPNASAVNIQDLLLLENRDRKYDHDVYVLRGHYTINDNDFDLSQFGLFLNSDTIYLTVHINDCVAKLGRKLMSGDVLELPHKKDYYPLNADIPAVLKRYYVVQDVVNAAEGYSPTWWPHLLRCKMTPLVDSQEYKDILNFISAGDANNTPIGTILSNYNKLNEINDAVIKQAEIDVPASGFDVSKLWVPPTHADGTPSELTGSSADSIKLTDSDVLTTDLSPVTPRTDIEGYLTGDGLAPDGYPVVSATEFPAEPNVGDYVLRLDFLPNRLFRYDGTRWKRVEDAVRTPILGEQGSTTQLTHFVNNTETFVGVEGDTHNTRQLLGEALSIKADN